MVCDNIFQKKRNLLASFMSWQLHASFINDVAKTCFRSKVEVPQCPKPWQLSRNTSDIKAIREKYGFYFKFPSLLWTSEEPTHLEKICIAFNPIEESQVLRFYHPFLWGSAMRKYKRVISQSLKETRLINKDARWCRTRPESYSLHDATVTSFTIIIASSRTIYAISFF